MNEDIIYYWMYDIGQNKLFKHNYDYRAIERKSNTDKQLYEIMLDAETDCHEYIYADELDIVKMYHSKNENFDYLGIYSFCDEINIICEEFHAYLYKTLKGKREEVSSYESILDVFVKKWDAIRQQVKEGKVI